jgi:hypothetical protein
MPSSHFAPINSVFRAGVNMLNYRVDVVQVGTPLEAQSFAIVAAMDFSVNQERHPFVEA